MATSLIIQLYFHIWQLCDNAGPTPNISYQTNTNKVRVRWKISKVRPQNTGELVVPFLVRVDELSLEN